MLILSTLLICIFQGNSVAIIFPGVLALLHLEFWSIIECKKEKFESASILKPHYTEFPETAYGIWTQFVCV